jgi:ribosomal protein S25
MDKAFQDKHNKALDMLQDYKIYLEKQVMNLKKLDQQSEFMKSWNETTIKEKTEEIVVIDKILKSLIRF